MERARLAGELLAARHHAGGFVDAAPGSSLVDYAERPRAGDWSMRSALVRLALPQPALVAGVLELVRRLDAVLHQVARPLERRTVVCDRVLSMELLDDDGVLRGPVEPHPDTRTADLVRLARSAGSHADVVVDAYATAVELDIEEQQALPLLAVALEFDNLAETLVAWAPTAPAPPPVAVVEATCGRVLAQLDALGVPREEARPPRGRRSRGT